MNDDEGLKPSELRDRIHQALSSRKPLSIEARGRRRGAVLIILYPDDDVKMIFTVRSQNVSEHKGQISFPGGSRERRDRSMIETAIRETYEETGIRVSEDQVVGRLDDALISVSNFVVTPFVAFLETPPQPTPDEREITQIIEVPLSKLMDPDSLEERVMESQGKPVKSVVFTHGEHIIWGATARMLMQFMEIIKDV
ncbi:MAG: NUDIX hydrolase [Candidatus Geothermarchaeales archaeon]